MLVNTAERLLNRSDIKILESYCSEGNKVYKILLTINRYEESVYSPLVVDNIIMTIGLNRNGSRIFYNVLDSTSPRCCSMFRTYKESLGEDEFKEYIRALNHMVKAVASALGLTKRTVYIIQREAWHSSVLSKS